MPKEQSSQQESLPSAEESSQAIQQLLQLLARKVVERLKEEQLSRKRSSRVS